MTSVVRIPSLPNAPSIAPNLKFAVYDPGTDITYRADLSAVLSLDEVSFITSGSTLTLDFNNLKERKFRGNAAIGAAKTWQFTNDSIAARVPSLIFEVSTLDAQEFPAEFLMADSRWDPALKTWTPNDVGIYVATIVKYGANWLMTIDDKGGPFI